MTVLCSFGYDEKPRHNVKPKVNIPKFVHTSSLPMYYIYTKGNGDKLIFATCGSSYDMRDMLAFVDKKSKLYCGVFLYGFGPTDSQSYVVCRPLIDLTDAFIDYMKRAFSNKSKLFLKKSGVQYDKPIKKNKTKKEKKRSF